MSENTLRGRGFARDGYGEPGEPDQWRPVVWGAVIAGCLLFWAGFFAVLPSVISAAIAVGDFLGITAR